MTHSISWEQKGVYTEFDGYVTPREYMTLLEQLCADPRFDSIHYILTNFSKVDGHGITDGDVEELISIYWANSLSNRFLLHGLIANNPGMVSLVRHFNSATPSGNMFHIFSSLDDARQWLAQEPWNGSKWDHFEVE